MYNTQINVLEPQLICCLFLLFQFLCKSMKDCRVLHACLRNSLIMPWQCLSVHLSASVPYIGPLVLSVPDFIQHALRYQIETWYVHLVGGRTHKV